MIALASVIGLDGGALRQRCRSSPMMFQFRETRKKQTRNGKMQQEEGICDGEAQLRNIKFSRAMTEKKNFTAVKKELP